MTNQSQGAACAMDDLPVKGSAKNARRPGKAPTPADVLIAAGALLRERREACGLTIVEVADRAKVSSIHLGEVERGKKGASAEVLVDVATALRMDLAAVCCAFRVVPERAAAAFFDPDRMRAALNGGGQ